MCHVLLGGDFQRQHKRVIFQYDGDKSDLIVPTQEQVNAVAVSDMAPAFLFKNLVPDCRPIAIKSRRYNVVDRKFIVAEIEKLLFTGLMCPSSFPWSA